MSTSRLTKIATNGLRFFRFAAAALVFAGAAFAQIPDGAGKAEVMKVCTQCHEVERSISLRQDRAGWQGTIDKMSGLGMQASDKDVQAVLNYLSTSFPADEVPKINVNTATAIQFESGLSLRRSQAAAIIEYRTKNGNFKSIDDLLKVPGIDKEKVTAKKDRLAF